jgi:hypothetical protein
MTGRIIEVHVERWRVGCADLGPILSLFPIAPCSPCYKNQKSTRCLPRKHSPSVYCGQDDKDEARRAKVTYAPKKGLHHRAVSGIEGLLTTDINRASMRISIKHAILLLIISSAFIGLTQATSCGGSCAIGTSYDFLGDPSIDMDTVNGLESPLQGIPLGTNPLQNQTGNACAIKNSFVVRPIISRGLENMTSENRTVSLGTSGMQYKRMSTLAFTALRNKF